MCFLGPKSKNRYGGTMVDDTDVSGRRSGTSKEDRKMARVCRAMWHRATVPRPVRAQAFLVPRVCFGIQSSWRLGFSSRGKPWTSRPYIKRPCLGSKITHESRNTLKGREILREIRTEIVILLLDRITCCDCDRFVLSLLI